MLLEFYSLTSHFYVLSGSLVQFVNLFLKLCSFQDSKPRERKRDELCIPFTVEYEGRAQTLEVYLNVLCQCVSFFVVVFVFHLCILILTFSLFPTGGVTSASVVTLLNSGSIHLLPWD